MDINLKEWENIINKQEEIGGCKIVAKASFSKNTDCHSFIDPETEEEGITFYVENEKLEAVSSLFVMGYGKLVIVTGTKIINYNIPEALEDTEEAIVHFLDQSYLKATEAFYEWLQEQLIGTQEVNKLPGIMGEISKGLKIGSFTISEKDAILSMNHDNQVNIYLPIGYVINITYTVSEGQHLIDTKLKDSDQTVVNRIMKTDITEQGREKLFFTLDKIVEPISL